MASITRGVRGLGLVVAGGVLLAAGHVRAVPVAYEFATTLNLTSITGPSSANVKFRMQYDPSLAGSVSSGNGNTNGTFTNGVSGTVTIDGVEVGTIASTIYLTETLSIDAVTLLFSQEPGAGVNTRSDNVPYFYDINEIRLSWGDNTRQMLTTAGALPADFDAFNGKPWSVQFDIYGTNAGTFGSMWGVRVINSPGDQPLNFVSAAVPEPGCIGLIAACGLLAARRRR